MYAQILLRADVNLFVIHHSISSIKNFIPMFRNCSFVIHELHIETNNQSIEDYGSHSES